MHDDKAQSLANELSIMAVRLVRWLRAVDEAPALSGPEASAMAVIVHSGRITPSALAALEQVRRPTITRVVDGLVERRLVRRERHPDDMRASLIVATEDGLALWLAGQVRRAAPLAARIAGLEPEERHQLASVLPLLGRLAAPPTALLTEAKP
ncbi:MAG: MarR family transcriptional regulator [Alphaproteobacteria bacterium]|nr:MarR family transcriptional regulator [Alphaproteobacteria bacterium]